MSKKAGRKRITKTSKKTLRKTRNSFSDAKMEKILVENFVSLQRVMTNLSVKFDDLATQISKLLGLFELSAKTLAEKNFNLEGKSDQNMVGKLDSLLEQNKTLARGLALLHEPSPKREYYSPAQKPLQQPRPQIQRPRENTGGYQRSKLLQDSSDSLLGENPQFKELPKKPQSTRNLES